MSTAVTARPLPSADRRAGRTRPHLGPPALVLCVLLGVAAILDWHFPHYWLDDPYISFRYAWNLVHGHGLTYNAGQHVEGFSNPSWTLLSAAALVAGVDPLAFTKVAGLGLHLATVAVLWVGVRRVHPLPASSERLPRTVTRLIPPALAAGAVATSSWTALWALAGLETPLFAFALVAAVVAYSGERRTLAALLMLLAALTRVEGIAFGAAFVVVLLRERGLSREVRRPLLLLSVPFLTVLLLRVAYYRHALPNSYTDKTGLPAWENLRAGCRYLVASLRRGFGLTAGGPTGDATVVLVLVLLAVTAVALLVALLRVRDALSAGRWLTAISVWAIATITVVGGGDWMPAARFLVPAVPLVALALGDGLTALLRPRPAGFGWPRRLLAGGCVLGAAATLVTTGKGQQDTVVAAIARYQPPGTPNLDRNPNYVSMMRWLTEHVPAGNLVGIEEAGLIPYGTPELRYLDLFGLTDETIARAPGTPPFDKHDNSYVIATRPDYLVIWGIPDRHGSFRWSHQLSLVRDRRFTARYRPVLSAPKDNRYTFIVYRRAVS